MGQVQRDSGLTLDLVGLARPQRVLKQNHFNLECRRLQLVAQYQVGIAIKIQYVILCLDFSTLTGFGTKNDDDEEANDSDLYGENSEADSEEYYESDEKEAVDVAVTNAVVEEDDDVLFAKGLNFIFRNFVLR